MLSIDTVSQGAPGGSVLVVYATGTGYLWFPTTQLEHIIAVGVAIAFFYLLLLELVSDAAIAFIALPVVFAAKQEINEETGSEHFYFDHEDKQSDLDDYDEKIFRYTTVFYAGVIIALTAPVQGYLHQESDLLLISLAAVFIAIGLSYLSFINMKSIIDTSVRLYE